MEEFMNQFVALADGIKLLVLGVLILANWLCGIAASIYTREFRLKKVGNFLLTRVLPYVISYFAVCFIAIVEPSWEVAVTFIWGVILAALVGAILANLKDMGINLPSSLGDAIE